MLGNMIYYIEWNEKAELKGWVWIHGRLSQI